MITRKEYIESNDPNRMQMYYNQFVTPWLLEYLEKTMGDDIRVSKDKHFNDIQLKTWDSISYSILMHNDIIRQRMKEHGDYLTLSGAVCILKTAAKQIRGEKCED